MTARSTRRTSCRCTGTPTGRRSPAISTRCTRWPAGTRWLSETGLATADLQAQAGFYDTMLRIFSSGARPWWTHLIFYRLWDGLDCCTEAIARSDFTPKPAFELYRAWNLKPLAVPRYPPR